MGLNPVSPEVALSSGSNRHGEAGPKRAKVKSMGAAQSPMLGAAMFGPAILYIVLLIGAPGGFLCLQ